MKDIDAIKIYEASRNCDQVKDALNELIAEGSDSEDTGRIPHDVDSFGTRDSGADHHNQYMMDQDLLQPLHKAAQAAGADDINDYMIKQIKDQGDNWVEWFIDTVIGDKEDY